MTGDGESSVAAAYRCGEVAVVADEGDVGETVAVEVGGDKAGGADGKIGQALKRTVAVGGE